ncbi:MULTISPECIES: hypothetical protein [Nostocales]|uniref:Uncharacterized protein n=3 Tax=Nostocales TaxID=1161 RepID=A0A0C1RB84_9CYAN|nr:hypothetical protein [Tolypothrix bouteillei]KAF3888176.1 hypothetical protein DA73_0400023800 [Tolypothrix bouteillei VB521301]
MTNFLTNPSVREVFTSLITDELDLTTGFVWFLVATIISMIAGAIGGMLLAGRDIGYQFSALLGGLFGPAGVIPGVVLALIVIDLLRSF